MADLGKSVARQIGNNGNSPVGQTGSPFGARGNAYYEFGSKLDAQGRISNDGNLKSVISPTGVGNHQASNGLHYYSFAAKPDLGTTRVGHSVGLFGGSSGTGATQADAGTLNFTSGTSVTTYFLMRGNDPNCVTQPTYRYWVVTGSPDPTGAQYTGARCGGSPLTNIIIESTWTH
jgi:hypothetical protein